MLEAVDGSTKFEAADEEPQTGGDRLDLLAVVRGLEALDQPSRVTVVTPSRYVTRGLRDCLDQWRESGWQWERFGTMTPISNGDLWRRVDRASRYHNIEVRSWRYEIPEEEHLLPQPPPRRSPAKRRLPIGPRLRQLAATLWQQAAGLGRLCTRGRMPGAAT